MSAVNRIERAGIVQPDRLLRARDIRCTPSSVGSSQSSSRSSARLPSSRKLQSQASSRIRRTGAVPSLACRTPAVADEDRDSALDAARRPAAPARLPLGRGGSGASRRLPLPRGAAHRPAPQSARPRARDGSGFRAASRSRSCTWRSPLSSHSRSSLSPPSWCSRRATPVTGSTTTLRPTSGRLHADRRRARSRSGSSTGSTRTTCKPRSGREAGHEVPRLDRDEGRREVHDEGAQLGRGRRARGRHAALQRGARRRRVDLHAARHAATCCRDRPPLPAASGQARRSCSAWSRRS